MFGLSPGEHRRVKYEDFPAWEYPDDYVTRLGSATADVNAFASEAIRQQQESRGYEEEETR